VAELSYSEDADLALRTLEADPSQSRLVGALYRALDELALRPDSGRRRRYTHDVWRFDVLDYAVLWYEDRNGEIVVEFIGPDF
jgi:plasmid stabilization system protein ParE